MCIIQKRSVQYTSVYSANKFNCLIQRAHETNVSDSTYEMTCFRKKTKLSPVLLTVWPLLVVDLEEEGGRNGLFYPIHGDRDGDIKVTVQAMGYS